MKAATRINRNFFTFFFIMVTIINTVSILHGNTEDIELRNVNPLYPILASFVLIGMLIPFILLGYGAARNEDVKFTIQKELKEKIPDVNKLLKMNCIMCDGKIDQPMNLIKHLGVDQTKQYIDFCEETHTLPSLYCCGCYRMVEKQPNWQKAMDDMINNSIKYGEYKKLYEDKLKMISE